MLIHCPLLALLEIRKKAEARRHNETLLAEHVAAGGDPSSAPTVDPESVDWLTGKASRLDNGETIQTEESKELEEQVYDIEGTTLQVMDFSSNNKRHAHRLIHEWLLHIHSSLSADFSEKFLYEVHILCASIIDQVCYKS